MSTQYTLYSHRGPGPNPLKAAVLMEHLGISYDVVPLDLNDDPEKGVKGAKFLKINPNGRVPCLVSNDSNGFSVWESGAILTYLADKHDKEGKFYGKTPEERAITMQWLTFQLSGLGPVQVSSPWFHCERLSPLPPVPF